MDRAAEAKRIAAQVAARLREDGFRKRGNVFNRVQPDGIVHIIQFAMQPSWSRNEGQGMFEFGVYVPRMDHPDTRIDGWVSSSRSHARTTSQFLRPELKDKDFDVTRKKSAERLAESVFDAGLSWLAGFADEQSLLDAYEREGRAAFGLHGRAAAFEIASLYRARGDVARGRAIVQEWVDVPRPPALAADIPAHLAAYGWSDITLPGPMAGEEQIG